MDVEAFEEAIAIARRTADREKKFGAYLEAMDLYHCLLYTSRCV